MKAFLTGIILFFICDATAQKPLVLSQSFRAKGDFVEQVTNCVNRWHQKNKTNDFYVKNVDLNPKLITGDSILYELIFITKSTGLMLWKGEGKFIKSGNQIICEVGHLVYIKRSSMQGIDFINLPANNMNEKIMNDRLNLGYIKKEVKQFFKVISK